MSLQAVICEQFYFYAHENSHNSKKILVFMKLL